MDPINYVKANPMERRVIRKWYEANQDGKCYHCKHPLEFVPPKKILQQTLNMKLFPPGFLRWPIHLHHCHKTDMTIGAVHAYCNGVLWQYHGE